MGKIIDLTGKRFGKLEVIDRAPNHPVSKKVMWNVICECGVKKATCADGLRSGKTISCGCVGKSRIGNDTRKYTNRENKIYKKEYNAWNGMRKRCKDRSGPDSKDYFERGISVHPEWETDFLAFLNHIGPAPKDGQRWSVGRIDNNLGYQPNNVEWELDTTQARNHSKQRNNKSGKAGVFLGVSGHGYGSKYWMAYWNELDGKRKSKCFSLSKYSYEEAYELACQYRDEQIKRLNLEGAGYAETHGLDK